MNTRNRRFLATIVLTSLLPTACATDQGNEAVSPGAVVDPDFAPGSLAYDKSVFHDLLAAHTKIRREVTLIDGGVAAITESDDPVVAAKIKDHAYAIQLRMQSGGRLRQWDPVFVELFDHRTEVRLTITPTPTGVRIVETSDNPEVVAILRAHAAGVSDFVREGGAAASRETPMVPTTTP